MWSMCHHTPPLPYTRHPRPAPYAHTPTHTRARDARTTTHARYTRTHDAHARREQRTACRQPSGTHRQNAPLTLRPAMPKHVTPTKHTPDNEEHHQRHTEHHTEHHAHRRTNRKTAVDGTLSSDEGTAGRSYCIARKRGERSGDTNITSLNRKSSKKGVAI